MPDDYRAPGPDGRLPPSLAVALPVAVGAVAGANLRYAVGLAIGGLVGTAVANVVGSGLLGALLAAGGRLPRWTRLLLGTGLLSSFTTYSTFALESATATPAVGITYVAATYGLGLAAVLVGRGLVRRVGRGFR